VKTQNIFDFKNPIPKYMLFFMGKQELSLHRVLFWLDIGGSLPISDFQNSFHTVWVIS